MSAMAAMVMNKAVHVTALDLRWLFPEKASAQTLPTMLLEGFACLLLEEL